MKRTCLLTTLVASAVIAVLASDALARYRMYNSATGTFMQRDPAGTPLVTPVNRNLSGSQFTQRDPGQSQAMPAPGLGRVGRAEWRQVIQQDLTKQYRDGMSLYQYVRSNPIILYDSLGLDVTYSGCECCTGIDKAVRRVNQALGTGACRQWFEDHGHDYSTGNPTWSIACHSRWKLVCLVGGSAWTMPLMRIGICDAQCEKLGPAGLASIIIHELAHHYCTIFWGREDCAMSAQTACQNALLNQ